MRTIARFLIVVTLGAGTLSVAALPTYNFTVRTGTSVTINGVINGPGTALALTDAQTRANVSNLVPSDTAATNELALIAAQGIALSLAGPNDGSLAGVRPKNFTQSLAQLQANYPGPYTENPTVSTSDGLIAGWNGTSWVSLSGSGGGGTTDASTLTAGILPAGRLPAFTGDVTSTAGSSATSVAKVNGGSLPVSAPVLASNGSGQIIAATSTGSGNNVLATSPSLITPALDTPSSVVLTNGTGLPLSTGVVGTLTDAQSALARKPSAGHVYIANVTPLSGLQATDGLTPSSGATVLLTAQTTASQNGPWVVGAGAWTRPTWWTSGNATQAVQYSNLLIANGTTYGGTTWHMTTSAPVTIDTTATTWTQIKMALGGIVSSIAGTVLSVPCGGGAASPSANTAPCATTFNATSATAAYQFGGSTILAFPTDNNSQISTLVGIGAGANLSGSAILTTAVGQNSCGGSTAGMTAVENTCIGWNTLSHATTGGFNTAVGVNNMGAETTGQANVSIGEDAMRDTVGVSNSVAVGANAMRNNSGNNNVAIGWDSLWVGSGTTSLGTSHDNTAVGFNTMSSASLTTANFNVAVGSSAGAALTTGQFNVLAGSSAGTGITTGGSNILLGTNAGAGITTVSNDVYIGANSGQFSTSNATSIGIGTNTLIGQASSAGNENIAIGYNTMGNTSMTTANNNLAVGDRNLQVCTSCANSVALGWHAGQVVTTGNQNVLIGSGVASTTLTTGSANILIGTSNAVDTVSSSINNTININNAIIGYATAPTLTSGFGTTPTPPTKASTFAFTFVTGTGPGTVGVVGLATAPTGWICNFQDQTSAVTGRQSANSTTSSTVTWSSAPTAGDTILAQCTAF